MDNHPNGALGSVDSHANLPPPLPSKPKISAIQENPLGFSDTTYQHLSHIGKVVVFGIGAKISPAEGKILIVEQGEIECFVRDAVEKRHLLSVLQKGEIIGELSSLIVGKPHDQKISLEASTRVVALEVMAKDFFTAKNQEPTVIEMFDRLMANRLVAMNKIAVQMVAIDMDPNKVEARTVGEKAADWVTTTFGRWGFIISGTAFTGTYMATNFVLGTMGWDPYPYIFLNLLFSTFSGFTAPLVMMSQNRQSQLDRKAAHIAHLRLGRLMQITEGIARRLKRFEKLLRQGNKETE